MAWWLFDSLERWSEVLSCTLSLWSVTPDWVWPSIYQGVIWVTRMLLGFFPACGAFLVSFSVYWTDAIYSGTDTIFDGIFSASRCLLFSSVLSVYFNAYFGNFEVLSSRNFICQVLNRSQQQIWSLYESHFLLLLSYTSNLSHFLDTTPSPQHLMLCAAEILNCGGISCVMEGLVRKVHFKKA